MNIKQLSIQAAVAGVIAAGAPVQAATWVYVANADSQDLSVYELDRAGGAMKPVATVPVGGMAMPMVVSHDKKYLYVALRSQPFRVVSFAIDGATGGLKKLGESALADNMANRPITASEWRDYEIAGTVDADATMLLFGLELIGRGVACIDDVRLEVTPS